MTKAESISRVFESKSNGQTLSVTYGRPVSRWDAVPVVIEFSGRKARGFIDSLSICNAQAANEKTVRVFVRVPEEDTEAWKGLGILPQERGRTSPGPFTAIFPPHMGPGECGFGWICWGPYARTAPAIWLGASTEDLAAIAANPKY